MTKTATVTAQLKRDLGGIDILEKRATPATCPATTTATSTPTYTACTASGTLTSRFASVCSCNGIVKTTTTLATPTSTITTTNSVSSQSTITQTKTATVTLTTVVATATATTSTTTVTNTITAPPSTQTVTTTTTLTSTVTSTTTTTVPVPEPTLCGNAGMSWGYWPDYQPVSGWDSTAHKQDSPSATGTTNQGYFLYTDGAVYGKGLPTTYFQLEQRGYIYATETGPYLFEAINVDDVIDAWVGPQAYSGWNQGNVNAAYAYYGMNGGAGGSSSTTLQLVKGSYYPFRIVYHQNDGYGGFNFRVTTPGGTVILGPSTGANVGIVQYSCDGGITAPQYPPFGQET